MKNIIFFLGKGTATLFLMLLLTSSLTFGQLTSYNANSIPIGGNVSVAVGMNALSANTGILNTAVGINSLRDNQAGHGNTGCGYNSLRSNTQGVRNTALGAAALSANLTGSYNTAAGENAMLSNTTGTSNVGIGVNALRVNTSGNNNTAVGREALYSNNSSGNTAVGYQVLYSSGAGFENSAMGMRALYSNLGGSRNAVNGYQALYLNTNGSNNTANGYAALYNNTQGNWNVAEGCEALYNNQSGNWNNAIGYQALYSNTTGRWNVANGNYALYSNNGSENTANGQSALRSNTDGIENTASGSGSLYSNTTGTYNTADGSGALSINTVGNYNTAIGSTANVITTYLFNATALGYGAIVDNSNKVRIGNGDVNSIGGQVAWSNFSDGRIKRNVQANVPGLEFIKLLKPVTYNFDLAKQNELLGVQQDDAYTNSSSEIEKMRFTGFIAQDVDAAAQSVHYDFSGVDKSGVIMGLRYSEFVVPLVKAVQELSTENALKDAAIDKLTQQVNSMQQQLDALLAGKVSSYTAPSVTPWLGQNVPNPFSSMTTIPYSLPKQYHTAQIVIADVSGKVMQQVTLAGEGKGELQIEAGSLGDGMYVYSLIVDGMVVRSYRMVSMK